MTPISILKILTYLTVLLLLVKPLGWYMAKVYNDEPCGLNDYGKRFENWLYRIAGIHSNEGMDWKQYLSAMLLLNFFGILLVYVIQRCQGMLPFNPQHFSGVPPHLAFNTAVSFVTNTNWQSYAGENTMSYLTQMLAFTVQNFLSAASGMSLLIALIRGLIQHESTRLGNFWVDTVRGILYILLPFAFIFSVILVSQGVIQNFHPYQKIQVIDSVQPVTEQVLPMGPVASQVAIKQLGTNGGGFFKANSAHPYENPTTMTNFLEMLAILLIPAALCYTFGMMVKDSRQGWALLTAMYLVFIPFVFSSAMLEQTGNPIIGKMGVDLQPQSNYPGGNMEGKETRFGVISSSIWSTATTSSSNGSVNSMLDSYTPLGGLIALFMMHLGEVIFGGVGSGLYGMLLIVIVTVFVSGLLVGRTPEYLGKKIEPYEMKMASLAVLVMPLIVLMFTAIAVVTQLGLGSLINSGPHGFSEILYAFTSMGNNNGSAFAGLNTNNPFYNTTGGITMLFARYWIAIPTLALAGSLAKKKYIPSSSGTLATHTPLFIILLIGVTVILGALSFLPAMALGPIVEHIEMWGQSYVH